MKKKDIQDLLNRAQSGNATQEEKVIAEYWLHQLNQNGDSGLSDEDLFFARSAMWQRIQKGKSSNILIRKMWPRVAAAAAILMFLSFSGYFLWQKSRLQKTISLVNNEITPGTNKAILHLSNGKTIVLTDAKNGVLAEANNTAINKTGAGEVTYSASADLEHSGSKTIYDTLTTPRGGIWHITLADGSLVWLNAETSIRYPESFKGKERFVELIKGEAYFEVTHNADKPFKVSVDGQIIEDLGTHFNINAYKDETYTKTTLLEGSIKLLKDNESSTLKPGEEAIFSNNQIIVKKADLDQAIAWKNGLFRFDNIDLKSLMRQFSRWYDIQVEYQGNVTDHQFAGEIRRNTNLSNVLKIMEQGGIHFKIEGRKLSVTP